MLKKDLTGKQFGRLTVLMLHSRTRNGHIRWICRCDCGAETVVIATHLQQGDTRSCGKHVQRNKDRKDWKGFEGISGRIWSQIKRGADGSKGRKIIPFLITIEEAWKLYEKQKGKCALTGIDIVFPEKWDTTGTASLDRIESDGSYEISNVQWVHKDINKMKNSFDQDYFIKLCKLVAQG